MSATPTPIEQKQSDNSTDSGASSSKNNWGSFGIAVVRNFISDACYRSSLVPISSSFSTLLCKDELASFFPGPGSGAYSPVPSFGCRVAEEFTCPVKR